MTNTQEEEAIDPAAALRLVRETRAAAAARVRAPNWYFPVMGALIGVQIASIASPKPGLSAVALCAIAVATLQYQKATGIWMNSLAAGSGRSRALMAGGVAVILTPVFLVLWLKRQGGLDAAIVGVGVAVGLFTIGWGKLWERVFVADEGRRS